MSLEPNETTIPEIEEKLERADRQNDRKKVKLLLNNLWFQVKGKLETLSLDQRVRISGIFDKYGITKENKMQGRFEEISEKIYFGGDMDVEQSGKKAEAKLIPLAGDALLVEKDETKG